MGVLMKKLIIIPAYNEEENIERTIRMIEKGTNWFCIMWLLMIALKINTKKICEKNHFNYVDLPINLGIGGAVQTGYKYALNNGYDLAVQVDGDGQHDPQFLEEMAEYLVENKLDMVIGSRFINKEGFQSSGVRRLGIKYFTGLIKVLTGKKITDPTSGLRMINKDIIEMFASDYPKDYPEPESIVAILRRKKKVKEIPVIMKERSGGVSSISAGKSIYYMIKVTLAILIESIRKRRKKIWQWI